jgi:hypothetical protein
MAARARASSPAPLAAAIAAVALLVASCSSHDTRPESEPATTTTTTTTRPEPPADPRLREVAGQVGCSATTPVDEPDGAPGAVLCEVDGRTVTRIQRFDPSGREEVERRLAGSYDDASGGGVECDGEAYRFVVLGDDWLVATDDPAVAGGMVVHHGAAFVGPDGVPSGDPASADVCR